MLEAFVTVLWLAGIALYVYGAWWFLKRVLAGSDRWLQWLGAMALWTCLGPFVIVLIGVTT
jgi:hypothetical protein